MNIVIGQVATGDKFYKRNKLIERLWKRINSGNNILMSAPRRIGKTSVMNYCLENQPENYGLIYLMPESVNNMNEFYRKLVNEVYNKLKGTQKISTFLQKLISSTKIKSIGANGISFDNLKETDYFQEFVNIAEQLDLEGYKLVLMVDEFAQVVENIMQDEGDSSAIHFLESVREIRLNPKIKDKMQFVFAGSIGLENIVARLNATSTINDLLSFKVPPFSTKEAFDYIISIALKDEDYVFEHENIEYLLSRLGWNIPYFINIILIEIETICDDEETNVISKEIIDRAFKITLKNRSYFEYWHTRLRKAYKKNDYNFAKEILNSIARNSSVAKTEIMNIAVELEVLETYKDIISSLEYDGYVNNQDDTNKYIFNSPLLKQWWFDNVTN
ncbi:MAG: ATP-binding protein [Bacteroidales bacterium]|nr:ATP-binding protein [Bacteroidales bacterium]